MVAIDILLLAKPDQQLLTDIGFTAIYVAAGLTLWSMLYYLKQAWPQMSGRVDK